jgi:multicomponent Na+:H+ antiporter subunit B
VVALLRGQDYLTHWWGVIPVIDYKISTVLLFDVGVYLCVWGALAGYALALLAVDEPAAGSQEAAP